MFSIDGTLDYWVTMFSVIVGCTIAQWYRTNYGGASKRVWHRLTEKRYKVNGPWKCTILDHDWRDIKHVYGEDGGWHELQWCSRCTAKSFSVHMPYDWTSGFAEKFPNHPMFKDAA